MDDQSTTSFGGMKDFSVDAQRRMFVEQQDRERQASENRRATRRIRQATEGATTVEMSGVMASIEEGGRRARAGDDDDDSLTGDWSSLGSAESFYVGIERADYAQPDNLEMYGEGGGEEYAPREDLFGISPASAALIGREGRAGRHVAMDWDADLPVLRGQGTPLHEFMNGAGGAGAARPSGEGFVASPVVGASLGWDEGGMLAGDDGAVDQVYLHEAAEGKTIIDKLMKAKATGPASGGGGRAPALATLVDRSIGGGGGDYPVLAPMALFSPGLTVPGPDKVVEGEDNGVRQMREREIRKEMAEGTSEKLAGLKALIALNQDGGGKVDAQVLMKMLDGMVVEP